MTEKEATPKNEKGFEKSLWDSANRKRYRDNYYDAQWLKSKELNPYRWQLALEIFWNSGQWNEPVGEQGHP